MFWIEWLFTVIGVAGIGLGAFTLTKPHGFIGLVFVLMGIAVIHISTIRIRDEWKDKKINADTLELRNKVEKLWIDREVAIQHCDWLDVDILNTLIEIANRKIAEIEKAGEL